MKVSVPWLVDVRTVEYREQEIELGSGQVLIRHVCTVPSIGTALHMYQGDHLHVEYTRKTRPWPYPWLQGYAYGVGRIEEIGQGVDTVQVAGAGPDGLQVGDLVYSMKLNPTLTVADPASLIVLPPGLDPAAATLVFQAMVALNGIRQAAVTLGDMVLVTGQGPIGNFCAQFCGLAGARQVVVSDLYDRQLAISRRTGIDETLNARTDDVAQRMRDLTGGLGADVVVEASGAPAALLQCAAAARRLAKVVVVGWIMDTFSFNLAEDFVPKGLELVVCHAGRNGSHRHYEKLCAGISLAQSTVDDKRYIFDLMNIGTLVVEPMITHRFPISDLEEAWHFIDSERDAYSQVVLYSDA